MGILTGQAKYVARMILRNGISGSAISLGRQDIFIPLRDFGRFCEEIGVGRLTGEGVAFNDGDVGRVVQGLIDQGEHYNKFFGAGGPYVSDKLFYASLGINVIDSVEFSDHESPTYVFDLNNQNIGECIKKTYDLVIDSGVMEHVFDVRNVFRNITDLAAVGGHIIHVMPGNNTFDHGFYQFSPTLFKDYYRYNNYDILDVSIMEYQRNPFHPPLNRVEDFFTAFVDYREWDYDDAVFRQTSQFPGPGFGGLTEGVFFSRACVRKKADSLRDRIPNQRLFVPY